MTVGDKSRGQRVAENLRIKSSAIAAAISAIAIADLEGGLTYANPSCLRLWGYDREEEVLGRPVLDFCQDEEMPVKIMAHLRTRGVWSGELKAKRKDGAPFDVLLWGSLVNDAKGEPVCMTASFQDITDRTRAEQEIRESEERFRKFADEVSFEGLMIHHDGKIWDINRQFSRMYGYERHEIVGMDILDTIAPVSREVVEKNVLAEYEKTYEAVALRKDKTTFPIEIHAKNMSLHGEMLRAAAIRDVSARKEAEESLRREKEKFRILTEESPLGIALIGKDGDTKYVNPKFIQTFGYTRKEIPTERDWVKRTCPEPEYGKGLVSTWSNDKHASAGRESRDIIFSLTCKDGSKKVIRSRSVIMENKERLITYEDITESRRLQNQLQQAQKMEAIGTLAGGIAHDFNNILGAIFGYTELALDGVSGDSPARRDLEQVLKAGNRAKELVKQILTFSRQTVKQLKPLRVSLILKEAVKLLRASLPSSIEIRLCIEPESTTVMADPTQVHQVLMNLCTNAAHAMREKGGILAVTAKETELDPEKARPYPDLNPGPYFSLSIGDTGHGMTPEVLERIFDPYFSTKPPSEGTGLGLAVVHGIIKSYGGTITVKSTPNKGTTFHALLPREETENTAEPDSPESFPTGKERVLFVDDEEIIADIARQQLTSLGYDVVVTTSSLEALELFRAGPSRFDLVMTDQTMPKLSGLTLARELMAMRADIPIILCTGFSELISEDGAKAIGIKAFVKKPILMSKLARIIREVLDG